MARRVTDQERNPSDGFLFSAPDDALSHLPETAQSDGLKLVGVDPSENLTHLCLRVQIHRSGRVFLMTR
jgi:hypothetical protein